MKLSKNLPALVLVILLTGCLFAYFFTRDSARSLMSQNKSAVAEESLVDTSLLQTALRVSSLAATTDEQAQAREAWRSRFSIITVLTPFE